MIVRFFYYMFLLPVSLLPYPLLYFLSDILYIIVYRILGYRKNVVFTNLQRSFPNKNTEELYDIMSGFYRHFCDVLVEILKGFTISEEDLRKRLVIKNPEISDYFFDEGQNVIFVGGHYNNCEICSQAFPLYIKHKCVGIYKSLKNKFMDNKIYISRSKYGMDLASMRQTKRSFDSGVDIKAILFASDQNPSSIKSAYWLDFLNQDTAVLFGAEKYAKEYNCPVFYVRINKLSRGYYEVDFTLLTDSPQKEKDGKITESFTNHLELDIINKPEYWLWSHRRWKHKR